MLTEQVVYGVKSIDPDTLPNTMSAGWRAACPGGEARKIHQGLEGAYPVSIWMFLCPRNPAIRAPENMWMKIISGQDKLYAVQLAHRRDARYRDGDHEGLEIRHRVRRPKNTWWLRPRQATKSEAGILKYYFWFISLIRRHDSVVTGVPGSPRLHLSSTDRRRRPHQRRGNQS